MRVQKDNLAYINHIHDSLLKITKYISTHNFNEFLNNDWDRDAVIRNLEIIGEAATNTTDEFKNKHPNIEWRKIKNFRNILAHDYADIDINVVWTIITINIPELQKQIEELLDIYKIK